MWFSALFRRKVRDGTTKSRRFYRQFVTPGGLCFDIGANVGERTATFLDLGARVVAVEPQASCAAVLKQRFGSRIDLVEAAVGATSGEAELHLASYHTIASLSPDWIEAVQASGRFAEHSWSQRVVVPMVTLDRLIQRYGVPDFCKIDVEGFELDVVRGLSQALPALSFEFEFERLKPRISAVAHLAQLGMTRFNVSFGESFELAMRDWVDSAEVVSFLQSIPPSNEVFGDVYAAR